LLRVGLVPGKELFFCLSDQVKQIRVQVFFIV
jgi:hypothetical protein